MANTRRIAKRMAKAKAEKEKLAAMTPEMMCRLTWGHVWGDKLQRLDDPGIHHFDASLDERWSKFRERFGRDPGAADPLLFDESAPTPQFQSPEKMRSEMTATMRAAGVADHLIYVFEKTGLAFITAKRLRQLPRFQREAWDAALAEYAATHEPIQ